MFAIVTKQRGDGTYSEVGMNDRWITGDYKTEMNLVRYGLANARDGIYRLEIYLTRSRFYHPDTNPYLTIEIDRRGF